MFLTSYLLLRKSGFRKTQSDARRPSQRKHDEQYRRKRLYPAFFLVVEFGASLINERKSAANKHEANGARYGSHGYIIPKFFARYPRKIQSEKIIDKVYRHRHGDILRFEVNISQNAP